MKNIFNFDGQVNGKQFDEEDISLTEAFAIFCGIGISCKLFIFQIICELVHPILNCAEELVCEGPVLVRECKLNLLHTLQHRPQSGLMPETVE